MMASAFSTAWDDLFGQVDLQLCDARLGMAEASGPELLEHFDHSMVSGQATGGEMIDAELASSRHQAVQKLRRDATPLPIVGDGHRDFSGVRPVGETNPACDTDCLPGGSERQ